MDKIRVSLNDRSYDIVVGEEILSKLGRHMSALGLPRRVVILSDSTVGKLYGNAVKHSLRVAGFKSELITVASGEKMKSIDVAKKIYSKLLELKVHRDSVFVALGGGVIGDLTGYVASTYMRGVPFVQVPTTLLSQVDASIGGKTAVNLEEAKNIVGTFYQPKLVFIDTTTIITLPSKEIRNGLAEVIKYGVIKDPELFGLLEKTLSNLKSPKLNDPKDLKALMSVWKQLISRSAKIKAKVVEADEKETKGIRDILNFGHTIGHAIESLSEYKGITHGEAVAIGMAATSKISVKMKLCSAVAAERLQNLIEAANLPTKVKDLDVEDIIAKLILDKKVRDGKVVFILQRGIGSVVRRNDVPIKILREALKEIKWKSNSK